MNVYQHLYMSLVFIFVLNPAIGAPEGATQRPIVIIPESKDFVRVVITNPLAQIVPQRPELQNMDMEVPLDCLLMSNLY